MNKLLLLLFASLCISLNLSAQNRTIKGKVVDESGNPVSGVNVLTKNARKGVQTDKDGNFTITVQATGPVDLIFSSIGYATTFATSKGNSTDLVEVKLAKSAVTQEDVVVVGYQTIRRKDLTSAVSSLGSKELKDNPLNSAAEALAGKLAGVQVNVSEGAPGADVDIYIRGRNSITGSTVPLYVVDGVQMENALSVLSPQDIQSIDVLKDAASTAIYGARGANGVVLITTKGGRNTGGKTTVTYNGFYGISKLSDKLDMMDPYNFVLYAYERAKYTANGVDTSVANQYIRTMSNFDTIAKAYTNYPTPMDWQKRIIGRNAKQMTHNVTVSGGTVATQYNLGVTYNKQEGLLLNSEYERKMVSFRFDHKVSDKLKVGLSTRYNIQEVAGAGTSDVGGAGTNRLRQFTRYRPMILPGQTEDFYDPDLDTRTPGNGLNELNPLLLLDAEYRLRTITAYNINGYMNYSITKRISFRSTASYDVNVTDSKAYDDTLTSVSRNAARLPIATIGTTNRVTINNSNVLTYSNPSLFKTKHALDFLVGHEIYETRTKINTQEIRYFPVGVKPEQAFANLNLASPPAGLVQPKPFSSDITIRQLSFFSRLSYNYNRKYLLTLNFRADASSLFGPDYNSPIPLSDSTNRKWGYFPSASVAWRFSQEKFMKNLSFVNDAKLRLSYGLAGNNRINPYGYTTPYSAPSNAGYGLNDVLNYTLTLPTRLGNPEIQWESLTSKNLGIDLALFKNRLNFTADFYENVTKDLLIDNKIPATSGYTTQYQNTGKIRNRGIELQLNGVVMQKKDFSWNANFNIAFTKNKILSLGKQTKFTANSGWFSSTANPDDYLLQVGGEVGTMYGLQVDGFYTTDDFVVTSYVNATNNPLYPTLLWQYTLKPGLANPASVLADLVAPGQIKYRDANGDGKINLDSDRVVIGHAIPKFTGGFSQQFTWKGFDASIFLNFCYGNDIMNANTLEYSSQYGVDQNMLSVMNDRWKVIDPNGNLIQKQIDATTTIGIAPDKLSAINAGAKIWQPIRTTTGFYPSSYAVEDGSYIRLNNVTIGYTLPKKWLDKAKISSFRVYATANNLGTLTGYSGYDPDVNSKRNSTTTPGVDYSAYPRGRTYVFGVNVSF